MIAWGILGFLCIAAICGTIVACDYMNHKYGCKKCTKCKNYLAPTYE